MIDEKELKIEFPTYGSENSNSEDTTPTVRGN